MIRIRKRPVGYNFHKLTDAAGKVVGLREHVEAHQPFYHGCVNSILLDWFRNGAQRLDCPDHDFKESVGALDFIVQNYFGLPPLLGGHRDALDRTTKPGLTWLRLIALKATDLWHVTEWTASRIAERCQLDGIPVPGATSETTVEDAAKLIGNIMTSAFGETNCLSIDGITVTRKEVNDPKSRLRKCYTFAREVA